MRRYRTVILVFVFGIAPMTAAAVLGVTVILPSLQQTDAGAETVVAVEEAPPPEPAMVRVALTAAHPLAVGTLLTAADLMVQEIQDADAPFRQEHYVYVAEVENLGEAEPRSRADVLRGYAVRQAMAAGRPVSWDAVVGPDDGQFLATVLAADRVAVSIPVSSANRQARLVSPGNRVDVLLAVEHDGDLLVRTIVEDVRVIAVNSRLISESDVGHGEQSRTDLPGEGSLEDAGPDVRPEVITVTLEVTPVEGEHLAIGAYEGQLSLAIRPLATALRRPAEPLQNLRSVLRLPEPEPEPTVDPGPPAPVATVDPVPPPPTPVSIRVVRGVTEETVVFTDGGAGSEHPEPAAGDPETPRIIRGSAPATPGPRPQ